MESVYDFLKILILSIPSISTTSKNIHPQILNTVFTRSSQSPHKVLTTPYSEMLYILHQNRSQTIEYILIFSDCEDCEDCEDLFVDLWMDISGNGVNGWNQYPIFLLKSLTNSKSSPHSSQSSQSSQSYIFDIFYI